MWHNFITSTRVSWDTHSSRLIRPGIPIKFKLCFDSGHANLSGHNFEHLNKLKDRLIVVHLHDNDGITDQHKIPFTGTVDWKNLAKVIESSSYDQCVNLEVVFQETDYKDEEAFLQRAHLAGEHLTELIKSRRIIS
jgi:sugar phosphate isomerase/epimerase